MVIHMQQKKENDNIMNYDTVRLDDENNAIIIIDQTKLPGSIELIALKTAEEIWDAIYLLRVRRCSGNRSCSGIWNLSSGKTEQCIRL